MSDGIEYFDYISRTLDPVGDCSEKQEFEKYIRRISNVLLVIGNNISFLATLYDYAEKKSKHGITPQLSILKSMLLYNTWGMTILQINTLVEQKGNDDTISVLALIEYASKHRDRIFTGIKEEARVREGMEAKDELIEWKKVTTKDVNEVIDHCSSLIAQLNDDKEKIRRVRNKIYSHNTKAYSDALSRQELLQEVSLVEISRVQDASINIINELSMLYDGKRFEYFSKNIPKETLEFLGE